MRENRVPVMMSDEELEKIDDWRFARRIGSRSDAIRRLVALGLASQSEDIPDPSTPVHGGRNE